MGENTKTCPFLYKITTIIIILDEMTSVVFHAFNELCCVCAAHTHTDPFISYLNECIKQQKLDPFTLVRSFSPSKKTLSKQTEEKEKRMFSLHSVILFFDLNCTLFFLL